MRICAIALLLSLAGCQADCKRNGHKNDPLLLYRLSIAGQSDHPVVEREVRREPRLPALPAIAFAEPPAFYLAMADTNESTAPVHTREVTASEVVMPHIAPSAHTEAPVRETMEPPPAYSMRSAPPIFVHTEPPPTQPPSRIHVQPEPRMVMQQPSVRPPTTQQVAVMKAQAAQGHGPKYEWLRGYLEHAPDGGVQIRYGRGDTWGGVLKLEHDARMASVPIGSAVVVQGEFVLPKEWGAAAKPTYLVKSLRFAQ